MNLSIFIGGLVVRVFLPKLFDLLEILKSINIIQRIYFLVLSTYMRWENWRHGRVISNFIGY